MDQYFPRQLYLRFVDFIYKKSGIVLKDNKELMLTQRLRSRMHDLRLTKDIHTIEEYWNYLQNNQTEELDFFLDAVSTNETYFQRGERHFEALQQNILPELYNNGITNITIWSCGCATGEEPYNLAMIAWDFMENHKDVKIEIKATDISGQALESAQFGEFADRKISKLTFYQREKFFNRVAESRRHPFAKDILQIKDFLKTIVHFSKLNLVKDPYFSNVHVIFCRNVMIYFDVETRNRVVGRLTDSLHPDGYLIVGHAESLHLIDTELKHVRYDNTTIYQRN